MVKGTPGAFFSLVVDRIACDDPSAPRVHISFLTRSLSDRLEKSNF